MLTTAATLNAHGIKDIQTSSQAAEALRPIAGEFAFAVFALGIVGTGMLAVPVLAGSAAYAVGEALRWRVGLSQKPKRAKAFYGAIAAATLIGAVLNFRPLDPIKALFWSAVINGVAAVPIMIMIMHLSTRQAVMRQFTLGPVLKALAGWRRPSWPLPRSACLRPGATEGEAGGDPQACRHVVPAKPSMLVSPPRL